MNFNLCKICERMDEREDEILKEILSAREVDEKHGEFIKQSREVMATTLGRFFSIQIGTSLSKDERFPIGLAAVDYLFRTQNDIELRALAESENHDAGSHI